MTTSRLGRKHHARPTIMSLAIIGVAATIGLAVAQGPPQGVPPVPVPPENPMTEAKRVLGKVLFWDEQLSSDNTMACGTCHIPASAGADPRFGLNPGPNEAFGDNDDIVGSLGVVSRDGNNNPVTDPIFGNDPQVTGRAAQSYYMSMFAEDNFWDGRATSNFVDPENGVTSIIANGGGLESQAVGPILSSVEMAHAGRTWDDVRNKLMSSTPMLLASNVPTDVAAALETNSTYADLFNAAFGDSAITAVRIAFAIASYERTLVADQAPWDLFIAGNNGAMTPFQQQGWDFLRNDTVCLTCHRPPLFTDNRFHNIGLRPSSEDLGREAITGNPGDRGRFKAPSLRNVGLRSSLTHVGWITDVQDALDFYNAGTQNTGHVQFTQDQTQIPGQGNSGTVNNINIPVVTNTGFQAQAAIVDFLSNALTDPRVATETFPFDRPTLLSEMDAEPDIYVDFSFAGLEDGTQAKPYDTLVEGLVHVESGGTVHLGGGTATESLTISQRVTLNAAGGSVVLGAAPAQEAPVASGPVTGFVSRNN